MKYLLKLPALVVFIIALLLIGIIFILTFIWHFSTKMAGKCVISFIENIESTRLISWVDNQLKLN